MSEKILKIDKKRNFLKSLPEKPGVYLFLDKEKNILYVGRSTILRKRVSSYFQKAIDERLQEMIQNASFIKIIPTANILESVILEANLIKKYWPKYNIRERDDRSFVYLVISLKQDFPRPLILRKKELEKIPLKGVEVFGPYKSYSLVKKYNFVEKGIAKFYLGD
ncbi:MAG: GIY-YIG nuclease family protein, partial [Minisyncoccia bacterium]